MNNDSTHVVPEPIKPVRIEHVADDVKLLKKSDVQQQKALLAAAPFLCISSPSWAHRHRE